MVDVDYVRDGWTSIMANIRYLAGELEQRGAPIDNPMSLSQLADFMKMQGIRDRVDAVVERPDLAELLKPWYDRFCKRPCFSDDYLPTFNRDNVTLVDTSAGRGVQEITEDAVVVDGSAYKVDCLIYSTGFDVNTPFAQRIGYDIAGRGGRTLVDKWRPGAATLHGIASEGFPNLFLMSVVQTGVSLNFTHMINEQAQHVAYIVSRALAAGAQTVEVTPEAEAAWSGEIDRTAIMQADFLRECTPSYFNFEGDIKLRNIRNSQYGAGPVPFYELLANWRASGDMPGFAMTHAKALAGADPG
jgi:cyclohexanone monooxygenase